MSDEPSLAVVCNRLDTIERRLDRVLDDHEARIRRAEAWIYALPAALIAAAASVAIAIVK